MEGISLGSCSPVGGLWSVKEYDLIYQQDHSSCAVDGRLKGRESASQRPIKRLQQLSRQMAGGSGGTETMGEAGKSASTEIHFQGGVIMMWGKRHFKNDSQLLTELLSERGCHPLKWK